MFFVVFSMPGAQAQDSGVLTFQQDRNAWRRQDSSEKKPQITPQMRDTIPSAALQDILQAEQAFCYTVTYPEAGYSGYTLDGLAVTGFCGVLNRAELDLFVDQFLSQEDNVSNVVADCVIQPRVMLRFVRGVDYADVLFSAPCHSFTIFYAGEIKSYNLAPAVELVDTVASAYEKRRIDFVSPALLQQLMPIGIAQTDAQKATLREKNASKPVRSWQTETTPQAQENEAKGWNRIKYGKNKP